MEPSNLELQSRLDILQIVLKGERKHHKATLQIMRVEKDAEIKKKDGEIAEMTSEIKMKDDEIAGLKSEKKYHKASWENERVVKDAEIKKRDDEIADLKWKLAATQYYSSASLPTPDATPIKFQDAVAGAENTDPMDEDSQGDLFQTEVEGIEGAEYDSMDTDPDPQTPVRATLCHDMLDSPMSGSTAGEVTGLRMSVREYLKLKAQLRRHKERKERYAFLKERKQQRLSDMKDTSYDDKAGLLKDILQEQQKARSDHLQARQDDRIAFESLHNKFQADLKNLKDSMEASTRQAIQNLQAGNKRLVDERKDAIALATSGQSKEIHGPDLKDWKDIMETFMRQERLNSQVAYKRMFDECKNAIGSATSQHSEEIRGLHSEITQLKSSLEQERVRQEQNFENEKKKLNDSYIKAVQDAKNNEEQERLCQEQNFENEKKRWNEAYDKAVQDEHQRRLQEQATFEDEKMNLSDIHKYEQDQWLAEESRLKQRIIDLEAPQDPQQAPEDTPSSHDAFMQSSPSPVQQQNTNRYTPLERMEDQEINRRRAALYKRYLPGPTLTHGRPAFKAAGRLAGRSLTVNENRGRRNTRPTAYELSLRDDLPDHEDGDQTDPSFNDQLGAGDPEVESEDDDDDMEHEVATSGTTSVNNVTKFFKSLRVQKRKSLKVRNRRNIPRAPEEPGEDAPMDNPE